MTDLGADPLLGPSAEVVQVEENGWIGVTDHYWMTTLIPDPGTPFTSVARYFAAEGHLSHRGPPADDGDRRR